MCRHVEKKGDDFRNGTLFVDGDASMIRDLLGKKEMHGMLDRAHEANLAATSMMANFQLGSNGLPTEPDTSVLLKKKPLSALLSDWRASFGDCMAVDSVSSHLEL